MKTNFSIQGFHNEDKKNIKNIYVQKIHSLMKLSKDTLLKEDLDCSNHHEKKNFKKFCSEADKNTLKLEKNRESAKKARQRKKIYIKMLESQIECFKRLKVEGQQLNQESQLFLSNQKNKMTDIQLNEIIEHDANVDKFLFGNDLGELLKIDEKQSEKKQDQQDKMLQEIYQLSTSNLVRKIKQSKNLQEVRDNMKSFELLAGRITHHYDTVKNTFKKINDLSEVTKNMRRDCRKLKIEEYSTDDYHKQANPVSSFMERMNLKNESQYEKMEVENDNSEHEQHPNGCLNNELNLHVTEKLLIRSEKFVQLTLYEEQ